jgi:hypothetical protein
MEADMPTSPRGLRSSMVDHWGNDIHVPYTSTRISSKLDYASQLKRNLEDLHNSVVEQDNCMVSPEVFECEPSDFDDDDNFIRETKKSGIFGTFANLANSIIGTGIVSIPYAVQSCGFLSGMFLLVSISMLAGKLGINSELLEKKTIFTFSFTLILDKSLRMIVDMAIFHPKLKFNNVNTYEALASYPFAKRGEQFILYTTFVMAV